MKTLDSKTRQNIENAETPATTQSEPLNFPSPQSGEKVLVRGRVVTVVSDDTVRITPVVSLLLALLLGLFPTALFGLGTRIPNQDAEAQARGNAFTATADTPAAIYYNPAGISQLEGLNAQFGMHIISVNSTFQAPNGTEAKTKWEAQPVPQFYATYQPKNSPLTYGVGIYAPFGLGLEWKDDSVLRSAAIEGRLAYVAINPVVSWKAMPKLSLAIGPTFNYSLVKLRQGISPAPATDEFHFRGHDHDFGFTAGVLYQPIEKISLGATYRSATTMNYRGHSALTPYAPATGTSAELDFPQTVTAGISYRPTPDWNIEADVDWTDWDTVNTVVFKGTATPSGTILFPLNWHASWLYEIGVTRYLNNGYFVSAGYFFSENSTSDKDFTPVVPDTDLHVGSLGFGYKGQHWRWALSGQIITGAWRDVTGANRPGVDGRYKWFNQAVNFSVGYHF